MKLDLEKILKELGPYRERKAMVDPKHAAFLVIDIQNFFHKINIESKDEVLPKKRYSAFYETDLDSILRSRGIQDLIISGVMTNLCCETTARDAFMKDYRVFFLIDGTATRKSELHLATLKNLGFGFAYLITCDELIQMLQ